MQQGQAIGPYVIVSPLGAGGMGEVYRARDTRLARDVALKVLPAAFASDANRLARFEREARAVAALSHPNILAIHDFGHHDGVVYATFELLEGSTLRDRLAGGPITPRKAAAIAAQVARGLDAAHSHGIVHRDIKPENLFMTASGVLKILDFGIARALDDSSTDGETRTSNLLTAPGVVIGTVSYMAPEQVRGEEVTAATDLFAVGVLLHEMISGRRPFDRDSRPATMTAVLQEDAPQLPATTPPALARVIDRLLEKAPEDRFRSALDLSFALEALSGDTGTAPALGTGSRRFILPLAIVGAIVVAAAGGWALGRSRSPAEPTPPPTFELLTFRRGNVFQARFGPRGTILYSAAWDGAPPEIFETSGLQREARALGLAPANLFGVSSSGEVALALEPRFPLTYFHTGRLATVSVGGGTPRVVVDDVSAADWTPNGRELALARQVKGEMRIELPFGRVVYSTTVDRDPVGGLRVSPEGDRVAFWHGHGSAMILSVVDRAGNRRDLYTEHNSAWGLAWTPDGREVWAAVGVTLDSGTIVAIGMDGRRREILKLPGRLRMHDISPEGHVLLTTVNYTQSLYVQSAGRSPKPLSWFNTTFLNDISSDGRSVLFNEGSGQLLPGLFHRAVDGPAPVRIGEGDFPVQSPRLSADGARAAAIREGKVTVWPVGAGEPRDLTTPSRAVDMLAWDGSAHVVYAAVDGGVYRQRADGEGAASLVAKLRCVGGPVASSDGRIACSDGSGRFTVVGMDGSGSRTIQPSEDPARLIGWSADNRAVYSYLEGNIPTQVSRTDLATGAVTRIAEIQPPDPTGAWRIHPVRVTPDGRTMAFTVARNLSELYLYKGLR